MKAPKNPLFPSKINLKHTARSKQYRAAATPLTQPAGHRRFSSLCSALPPEALPGHGPPIAGERGWAGLGPSMAASMAPFMAPFVLLLGLRRCAPSPLWPRAGGGHFSRSPPACPQALPCFLFPTSSPPSPRITDRKHHQAMSIMRYFYYY